MRFARDSAGQRICADYAIRGNDYFCPTCGKPLVLKRGKKLLPHFAHFPNQPCTDSWSYDESPWQQQWQSRFPAECQEVIISHDAQTHRADIVAGDTVMLLQETAITAKFFNEKTRYFQKGGKDVFWIINVQEDMAAGILRVGRKDKNMMFWDHPPKFLQKVDLKADKKLHIVLDMGNGQLRKVEWIKPGSNFECFIVDSSYTPDLLTEEGRKDAAMNQYARFDAFKQRNMPWKKKISVFNGHQDPRWHTCEKTGVCHSNECTRCVHNLIVEHRTANEKTGAQGGLFFYCRYPEVAQPMVAGSSDGKQKVEVPEIWLK